MPKLAAVTAILAAPGLFTHTLTFVLGMLVGGVIATIACYAWVLFITSEYRSHNPYTSPVAIVAYAVVLSIFLSTCIYVAVFLLLGRI